MPPKKKIGRTAAEAAYADLLKDNTALVGDVGEAFGVFVATLENATAARERYEQARIAAVKGGALTNEQLDHLGYKKSAKLPTPPTLTQLHPTTPAASQTPSNGGKPSPQLASVGATPGEAR